MKGPRGSKGVVKLWRKEGRREGAQTVTCDPAEGAARRLYTIFHTGINTCRALELGTTA